MAAAEAARLGAVLAAVAARGETIGYGALAAATGIGGAGRIGRLAALLEVQMAADAAAGRPFLAAACAARLGTGLPAPGFFVAAAALGRYAGPPAGPAAAAFVAAERAALRQG